MGDYFSKWLDAISVKDQEATTIAKAFVKKIVSIFGAPYNYILTKGQTVFREICKARESCKKKEKQRRMSLPLNNHTTALQKKRQNTKPQLTQLTQQLESTNERVKSNVERPNEDDCLSLYAEGLSDTEYRKHSMRSSPRLNHQIKTSASHLLENLPSLP